MRGFLCVRVMTGFVLLFSISFAQPTPQGLSASQQTELNAYMNAWQQSGFFSGVVLIERLPDAFRYVHSVGVASTVTQQAMTADTVFQLGSLSKPIIATAILALKDAGRLDMTAPLGTYLPDVPYGEHVTIYQLLTHSSGIPDYAQQADYLTYMNQPITLERLVQKIATLTPQFEPGSRFAYSNSNYVLLSAIIENITAAPFDTYLHTAIFTPATMHSSGYGAAGAVMGDAAKGYRLRDDGLTPATPIDFSVTAGAGGLYSSAADLAAFIRALQQGALLKPATLQEALEAHMNAGAGASGVRAYSLGWFMSTLFNRPVISHSGGVNGYSSQLVWFEQEALLIVVLSNLDAAPVTDVARGLAAIVLSEPYDMPVVHEEIVVPPDVLKTYVGTYAFSPAQLVSVHLNHHHLTLAFSPDNRVTLYPYDRNKFFLRVANVSIEFMTENQHVKGFIWRQNNQQLPAIKLP